MSPEIERCGGLDDVPYRCGTLGHKSITWLKIDKNLHRVVNCVILHGICRDPEKKIADFSRTTQAGNLSACENALNPAEVGTCTDARLITLRRDDALV